MTDAEVERVARLIHNAAREYTLGEGMSRGFLRWEELTRRDIDRYRHVARAVIRDLLGDTPVVVYDLGGEG